MFSVEFWIVYAAAAAGNFAVIAGVAYVAGRMGLFTSREHDIVRASLKAGYYSGLSIFVIGLATLIFSTFGWAVMAVAPLAAVWEIVRTWKRKELEQV